MYQPCWYDDVVVAFSAAFPFCYGQGIVPPAPPMGLDIYVPPTDTARLSFGIVVDGIFAHCFHITIPFYSQTETM